ncbi:MAG: phosphatase PAP2 family protein [Phycisphaerae bacterium]
MLASVGCSRDAVLSRQAEATHVHLLMATAVAERGLVESPSHPAVREDGQGLRPRLYFALRGDSEAVPPGAPAEAAPEAEAERPVPQALEGLTFGDIVREDLRGLPRSVGRGFVHTYSKPENLIILGTAFGVDRIVRHNWDEDVRHYFEDNDSSLAETDDFGSIIGNPGLHFLIGGTWYLAAVGERDARQRDMSKTLIEALVVTNLSTLALKVGMDDRSPNGEKWGWPSGHTSSSVCFAAVMQEYYGWKAGVPLYLLAGYTAASRLEDREHDLSDLVFGAALGWVVAHSVVRGELPQVAGFYVLPYGGRDVGGLMLFKRY